MFEKYSNAKELEALEADIKAIDPNLRIGWLGISGDKATSVGVYVVEKGNKKIINKLCELGFAKRRREKIPCFGYYGNEPLAFRVVLTKDM